MKRDPKKTIDELRMLKNALIDSSSLIYARRLRCLKRLSALITLETLLPMQAEVTFDLPGIHVIPFTGTTGADAAFIQYARSHQMPVISEDKDILNAARSSALPHFNMLMMLELLFLRNRFNENAYKQIHDELLSFAWYSEEVREYGEKVHALLLEDDKTTEGHDEDNRHEK